jgi:hypothetical protein
MRDMATLIDPFAPLTGYYAQLNAAPATPRVIDGAGMPEPYRSLLVSSRDMTPTLERFHSCKLHLRILDARRHADEYRRHVALLDVRDRVVEFGAIHIHLDALPVTVQDVVLEGRRPLGGLLIEHAVVHHSCPSAYFSIVGDDAINRALQQREPGELFGRCNTLVADNGRAIAEVVEILPRIAP